MKSKTLKYIFSVVFVFVAVIAMFTMTTLKVNAEENEYVSPTEAEAKIYGASVNLGGDISMKYYVEIGSDIDINNLILETFFLGKVENLTAEEQTVLIDGHTLYVYTLSSINPQCMGDPIDAKLVYNGNEMEGDRVCKNDYSVKINLENTYKNTTDENLKSLIIDTLKYGKAAQIYKSYKTDAFVTDGELADVIAFDTDDAGFYNQGYKYIGATDDIYLVEDKSVTVNFSNAITLKFKYVAPEGTKVTINGEKVTPTKDGDYWIVETRAIAATDFYDLYTVVIADLVTVTYSVNGYCEHIWSTSSNLVMRDLAFTLYNYGLSAHIYDGTGHLPAHSATCYYPSTCKICWHEYGDMIPHNYTYTVNEESNTITESCDQGCNHNKTLTLKAPENAVYTGSSHEATVEGDIDAEYEITYNENPINAGTYTATLTVGENSVSVEYVVEKVNPTVVNPTSTTLTYTGDEQELISAGSTNFGTMVYSLSEDGEYTENIPTGINAGKYVVYYYVKGNENINDSEIASIEVEIAKAESTIKTHPEANDLTYTGVNQLLVTEGIFDGGTLVYALDENGEYTAAIPYGTNAGEYKVWYYVEGDLNHNDSEKHSIDVTIEKALPDYFSPVLEATYGQTLGDLNPDSGSLIITPGKWTWDDAPDTLVGDVGKHLFDVTFTPNNDNYQTIHTAAIVTVSALEIHSAAELFITLDQDSFVYDGTEKKPNVISVVVNDVTVEEDKDYTVSYNKNIYVGEYAEVIITFKGNYSGTIIKYFTITQDPKTTEFEGEWVTIPKN